MYLYNLDAARKYPIESFSFSYFSHDDMVFSRIDISFDMNSFEAVEKRKRDMETISEFFVVYGGKAYSFTNVSLESISVEVEATPVFLDEKQTEWFLPTRPQRKATTFIATQSTLFTENEIWGIIDLLNFEEIR